MRTPPTLAFAMNTTHSWLFWASNIAESTQNARIAHFQSFHMILAYRPSIFRDANRL